MCFAFSINVWFHVTVIISEGNFVHYVNTYCALLLAEYIVKVQNGLLVYDPMLIP